MKLRARALAGATLLCAAAFTSGCTRLPELGSIGHVLSQTHPGVRSSRLQGASELTLEHLQVKGSHNSYHQRPRFALARGWRYSHRPLAQQLEQQGVRQIELDVRYMGGKLVVGHLPMIDGRSSCRTLQKCLEQIKGWSDAHPAHLPVFVFIEPKEHLAPSNLDGRVEVLDRTIARVFPRESLILPEQVAGDAPSLRAALRTRGWPSVAGSRGKVAFVFFGRERLVRAYAQGRPRLQGRLMFAAGDPEDPWAAVTSYDNPLEKGDKIARAVREHMLVRTRADSELKRDRRRRDAALSSGAHFIGTDFVDPAAGWIELGELAPVRCNPVLAPERCTATALAEVEQLHWAGLGPVTSPLAVQ